MSIERKRVEQFHFRYLCDEDGCEGEMRYNRTVDDGEPNPYMHLCTVCNAPIRLDKVYPTTENELVDP
jgi:hypothetical protein